MKEVWEEAGLTREEYDEAMSEMANALNQPDNLTDEDLSRMHVDYVSMKLKGVGELHSVDWLEVKDAYQEAKELGDSDFLDFKGVVVPRVIGEYYKIAERYENGVNDYEYKKATYESLDYIRERDGIQGDEVDLPYYEAEKYEYGKSVDELMKQNEFDMKMCEESTETFQRQLLENVRYVDSDLEEMLKYYIEHGQFETESEKQMCVEKEETKVTKGIDFTKPSVKPQADKSKSKQEQKSQVKMSEPKVNKSVGRKVSGRLADVYQAGKDAGLDGSEYE